MRNIYIFSLESFFPKQITLNSFFYYCGHSVALCISNTFLTEHCLSAHYAKRQECEWNTHSKKKLDKKILFINNAYKDSLECYTSHLVPVIFAITGGSKFF